MRLFARVGGVLLGSTLLAGCFSPLTTLPAPPDDGRAAGDSAACGSGLQLGSYCEPDSRSSVVLPAPAPDRAGSVADPSPTAPPTAAPAWFPIAIPAVQPTGAPTVLPTAAPVALPTPAPLPVDEPTLVPIVIPAELPAATPTPAPTATPTPGSEPDDGGWLPPGHDRGGGAEKGDRPKKDKNKDRNKAKGRKGD